MRLRSVVKCAAVALAVASATLSLSACTLGSAVGAGAVGPTETHTHTVVVAIGDSITAGRGLAPDQAWPILVARTKGWAMTNLGTSGAGFNAKGTSGETYDAQIDDAAALHPQLVLINGSDNDIGHQNGLNLIVVTDADMHNLRNALPHATIVALSVIAPQSSAVEIAKINARVAVTAKLVHGIFLNIGNPLAGHDGMLQSDGEHPTAAGQQAIADAVDAALTAKHVTG